MIDRPVLIGVIPLRCGALWQLLLFPQTMATYGSLAPLLVHEPATTMNVFIGIMLLQGGVRKLPYQIRIKLSAIFWGL